MNKKQRKILSIKFGHSLRAIRIASDISQIELSKKLGIVQGQLSKIENGSRSPNVEMLFELTLILGAQVIDNLRDLIVSDA